MGRMKHYPRPRAPWWSAIFLVLKGACQFGHGIGGFTAKFIHSRAERNNSPEMNHTFLMPKCFILHGACGVAENGGGVAMTTAIAAVQVKGYMTRCTWNLVGSDRDGRKRGDTTTAMTRHGALTAPRPTAPIPERYISEIDVGAYAYPKENNALTVHLLNTSRNQVQVTRVLSPRSALVIGEVSRVLKCCVIARRS